MDMEVNEDMMEVVDISSYMLKLKLEDKNYYEAVMDTIIKDTMSHVANDPEFKSKSNIEQYMIINAINSICQMIKSNPTTMLEVEQMCQNWKGDSGT